MTGQQPTAEYPDPADVLGPLELPGTWQERAELLENLLRAQARARGTVVSAYATAYHAVNGTDTARTQAAKLATVDAQLYADQVHARLAAYKLLLDVAREGATDIVTYEPTTASRRVEWWTF